MSVVFAPYDERDVDPTGERYDDLTCALDAADAQARGAGAGTVIYHLFVQIHEDRWAVLAVAGDTDPFADENSEWGAQMYTTTSSWSS